MTAHREHHELSQGARKVLRVIAEVCTSRTLSDRDLVVIACQFFAPMTEVLEAIDELVADGWIGRA
jgi:hypothetical protein